MKTRLFWIRLFLLIVIFVLPAFFIKAQIHRPYLQVPLIKTAPAIDGKLSDVSWQNASEVTEFVNWSLDSYIKDPVSVFIYHDEKNLYVAFRNSDPDAGGLNKTVSPKGPRDTFLWGRNHAMVGIGYKDTHIQLMADPKGTMTDFKNDDIKWNGNWQYGVSVNQSDWTAEFTIPLLDFGMSDLASGTELNLTLSRSYPQGESSNWSGQCNLSAQTIAKCEIGRWPVPLPGKNPISFSAQNFRKEAVGINCELEIIPLNSKPEFINQAGQGPSSNLQILINSEPL